VIKVRADSATLTLNAIMIHTPVQVSWLNQMEIVFPVIQKKVFTPGEGVEDLIGVSVHTNGRWTFFRNSP
jgi:hypothetical protein